MTKKKIEIDGYGDGCGGCYRGDGFGHGDDYSIIVSGGDGCGHLELDDLYWESRLDGTGHFQWFGYEDSPESIVIPIGEYSER
jgi:hypothetical protein